MTEHLDLATLSAYLDNELAPDEHTRAANHLPVCEQCSATLAELGALSRSLQALPCAALPDKLSERLHAQFAPAPGRTRWQRRWMQIASAAASIMLGLLIGSALQEPPQARPAAASMLAVLGSAPPGALCARPELCYLKVNLK
ncbi:MULTISPECIES: zf-HC2 domain-containing protein [unclassified Pseudomonas]|uniref:anti-sigma factor family protein n=1 Tax=unclassified Pseudomonas TaxID=196821 RepID=UPI0011F05531|nr:MULTISPECIES: zf-HC2 domain-containing protein [unclassified Pseudomonas]KAA0943190.1 hypothetical protein FQ182_26375 [Pseudomonas sp. ANT_H4]KAA0945885.1 hypothetical protein FQ186_28015 [Pseudomonas sp. ANT_H14]